MKKLFLILLAAVLVFSSCSGEKTFEGNKDYDMTGNEDKDKPSPGNYFIYTPIIDIFTPETGEEISFLDFDGTKFIMDSGTDKAFLLSHDLLSGKTENLTNKIGFHSYSVLSDGDEFYCVHEKENEQFLICKNSAGETVDEISITLVEFEYSEDYVPQKINYRLFKSGKNIVVIEEFENGGISTISYNTETKEILDFHKNLAVPGHETIPMNGYITYVEENNGLFSIFAFEPTEGKQYTRGPSLSEKVLFSAFDGKHFVWSTESGIYFKNSAGKRIQLSETGGRFAFLGRNFIFWTDEDGKLKNYRIDKERAGGYSEFSGLEMVFSTEDIAVFKNSGPEFEEKYISVAVKRGEEPLEWADAANMAPATIAVDGYDYYCYYEKSDIIPSERQIAGKITSAYCDHSTGPRKNNQGNSAEFLGSRYAFVDGELLIEEKGEKNWYLCEKGSVLSDMNMD